MAQNNNHRVQPLEETVERIRALNEQILVASKKAGGAYLDASQRALESVDGYQRQLARQTNIPWVATVVEAQSDVTRELANAFVAAGRELVK